MILVPISRVFFFLDMFTFGFYVLMLEFWSRIVFGGWCQIFELFMIF